MEIITNLDVTSTYSAIVAGKTQSRVAASRAKKTVTSINALRALRLFRRQLTSTSRRFSFELEKQINGLKDLALPLFWRRWN